MAGEVYHYIGYQNEVLHGYEPICGSRGDTFSSPKWIEVNCKRCVKLKGTAKDVQIDHGHR